MGDVTTGDVPAGDVPAGDVPAGGVPAAPADMHRSAGSVPDAHRVLLANLHARLGDLEALAAEVADVGGAGEDLVYRFWHQSFKTFALQGLTVRVVSLLEELSPSGRSLDPWFVAIVADGTGRVFVPDDNDRWLEAVGPIVTAYLHALHMLRLAVRYGRELDTAPVWLPSGWATLLELYRVR